MESRTAQIPMETARAPVRVPTVLQSVLFFRLFLLRIRFFERDVPRCAGEAKRVEKKNSRSENSVEKKNPPKKSRQG